MIELKIEHPFNEKENLIRHYAEDENGKNYYILQVETNIKYSDAIDVYPCRYTYEATEEELIEDNKERKKN